MRPIEICPSILAADFLKLQEQVTQAESGGADRFQIDVMDGVFVPNISFGVPLVEAMRRATTKLLEVHLMIVHPDHFLDKFAHAGADLLIIHQESVVHLDSAVRQVKQLGKEVGVALNPATSVTTLDHIVQELDMVLVMTVNPGFGGQEFIPYTLRKIRQVRDLLDQRNPDCDVEIDGGVELHTIRPAYEAGANIFVVGTSVFGYLGGPKAGVESLLKAAEGA